MLYSLNFFLSTHPIPLNEFLETKHEEGFKNTPVDDKKVHTPLRDIWTRNEKKIFPPNVVLDDRIWTFFFFLCSGDEGFFLTFPVYIRTSIWQARLSEWRGFSF